MPSVVSRSKMDGNLTSLPASRGPFTIAQLPDRNQIIPVRSRDWRNC